MATFLRRKAGHPGRSHQSTLRIYQRYRIELVLLFSITLYIDNPTYIYISILNQKKNHPCYFRTKCKRMSSQARETYTPALTRCNTKKGTGVGLRRHEKTRPGSPSPNHKIKWPSPWSLQTPVYKSHLHSARVDPPRLKGVHLSPEVRSPAAAPGRPERKLVCFLL